MSKSRHDAKRKIRRTGKSKTTCKSNVNIRDTGRSRNDIKFKRKNKSGGKSEGSSKNKPRTKTMHTSNHKGIRQTTRRGAINSKFKRSL